MLEDAGWTNVGKANLHEFAYGVTSQNVHYGTVPNPAHPYGAKGVGEVNICPPMAAIANAIAAATGVRMTELPMSPPRLLEAIDAKSA